MIQGCSVNSSRGRWVLLGTLLASSTAFLMGTVVVITLPAIQLYFHARITGIQWIVNAHLLFLAGLLLIGGALGDRFGADDTPPLEYGQAFPEESHLSDTFILLTRMILFH